MLARVTCYIAAIGAARAMAAQASTPHRMRASCYCGAVHVVVADADAATSSSICHCSVCRRLSGAPFLANVLFKRGNVALETADGAAVNPDALTAQATSKHVTRYRCKACASPVLAHLGKDAAAAPLALFPAPHPASWAPAHHMHYMDRVLDVHDGKKKFSGRFGYSAEVDDWGEPLQGLAG